MVEKLQASYLQFFSWKIKFSANKDLTNHEEGSNAKET